MKYANLNNSNGDNGIDGSDNNTEIRSVEYVSEGVEPAMIKPATIRAPAWWLIDTEYSTRYNNEVNGDNGSNKSNGSDISDGSNGSESNGSNGSGSNGSNGNNGGNGDSNGGRRHDVRSDIQTLERRSSLYDSILEQFGDDNEIGIAGPSTIYSRTRSGGNGISYEMIGNEYGNINMGTSRSGTSINNEIYERINNQE